MTSLEKYLPILVVLILFLFFSPIWIYKANYKSKVSGQSNAYNLKQHQYSISQNNSNYKGSAFNSGFNIPFSTKNNASNNNIRILKYRHLNLGVYSRIEILAECGFAKESGSTRSTIEATFNIYGLAGYSIKKAYAVSVIQKEVDAEKIRYNLAIKKLSSNKNTKTPSSRGFIGVINNADRF
jgi:hypothetical protein